MGTLKGFPYPPAMVRGEQSSPAPHAISLHLTRPDRGPRVEWARARWDDEAVGPSTQINTQARVPRAAHAHASRVCNAGRFPLAAGRYRARDPPTEPVHRVGILRTGSPPANRVVLLRKALRYLVCDRLSSAGAVVALRLQKFLLLR